MLREAAAVADWCAANAPEIDRDGAFPVEEFRLLAEAGLLAPSLPRAEGGLGLGTEPGGTDPLLRLLRQIGRGSLPVGRVYEGHVNALHLIDRYGTPAQRAAYAADARDDRHLFAVWNTEAGDGVKLHPLGGGRYRLEGAKTFCSGASHIARPIITGATPDGGWQMIVVPLDEVRVAIDPSWWQVSGMRASASYKIDFTGVEVGPHAVLGQPGDYLRQPWFSGGAIRFTAVQLGGAEALLDATRAYLRGLSRTDDPYQRHRLGQLAIAVESGTLWLRGAAEVFDRAFASDEREARGEGRGARGEERSVGVAPTQHSALSTQHSQIIAYANMTRTAIERICMDALELAERAVGARGLLRAQPVERIGRDLTLYLRQPAPDAALADVGRFVLESDAPARELWTNGANDE